MKQYNLIIPIGLKPEPDKYEKAVARLCAEKFQSDILFVKRGVATTPDIQVVRTGQFGRLKIYAETVNTWLKTICVELVINLKMLLLVY